MNEADLSCRLRLEKGFLVAFDTPPSPLLLLHLLTGEVWEETNKQWRHVSMFQKQADKSGYCLVSGCLCLPLSNRKSSRFMKLADLGRRRPRRMKMGGRSLIWQNWQLREIGARLRRSFTRWSIHHLIFYRLLRLIESSSFRYVYDTMCLSPPHTLSIISIISQLFLRV